MKFRVLGLSLGLREFRVSGFEGSGFMVYGLWYVVLSSGLGQGLRLLAFAV